MYPSTGNEQTGLNLPSPVSEQIPPAGMNQPGQGQEVQATAAEAAVPGLQPTISSVPVTPIPVPGVDIATLQQATSGSDDMASSSGVAAPDVADDSDLIEKEWVNKAKQIVEKNRDNPYQQSVEMTLFKADYMKKRYNKVIKLSE